MPAISFSRRQWLGVSALGGGCALAPSRGLAEGAAAHLPLRYTPPEGTDLSKAPGLRSKLLEGGEGHTRGFAVTLGKGDEIMSGMIAFARRERLQAAHFTAIDAIEHGLFGWFDERVKAFRNLPVDEQAEAVSLVGDIGLVNGASSVHVHAVFILADGTAVICRQLMFGRRSRFLKNWRWRPIFTCSSWRRGDDVGRKASDPCDCRGDAVADAKGSVPSLMTCSARSLALWSAEGVRK